MMNLAKVSPACLAFCLSLSLWIPLCKADDRSAESKELSWEHEAQRVAPNGELSDIFGWFNLLEMGVDFDKDATTGFKSTLKKIREIYPESALVPEKEIKIEEAEKAVLDQWPQGAKSLYIYYLRILESSWRYWHGEHDAFEAILLRPDTSPIKWGSLFNSVDPLFFVFLFELSHDDQTDVRKRMLRFVSSLDFAIDSPPQKVEQRIADMKQDKVPGDISQQLPSLRIFRYRQLSVRLRDMEEILGHRLKKAIPTGGEIDYELNQIKFRNRQKEAPSTTEDDEAAQDDAGIVIPTFYLEYITALQAFESERTQSDEFERSFRNFQKELYTGTVWNPDLKLVMQGDELRGLDALVYLGPEENRDKNRLASQELTKTILRNAGNKHPYWLNIRGNVPMLLEFHRRYKRIAEQHDLVITPLRRLSDCFQITDHDPVTVYERRYEQLKLSENDIAKEKRTILKYADRRRDGALEDIFVRHVRSRDEQVWFLQNVMRDGGLANIAKLTILDGDGVVDQ